MYWNRQALLVLLVLSFTVAGVSAQGDPDHVLSITSATGEVPDLPPVTLSVPLKPSRSAGRDILRASAEISLAHRSRDHRSQPCPSLAALPALFSRMI